MRLQPSIIFTCRRSLPASKLTSDQSNNASDFTSLFCGRGSEEGKNCEESFEMDMESGSRYEDVHDESDDEAGIAEGLEHVLGAGSIPADE